MHYYLQYIQHDLNEAFFFLLFTETNLHQKNTGTSCDAKGRQPGAEVTPKRQRSLEYKNAIVHEASYPFKHIRGTEMQKKVGELYYSVQSNNNCACMS